MIWTAPSEKDTATIGFEADFRPFAPRHAEFVIRSASWQHVIHRLATQCMAGFVLANGSMSSNQSGEGDIRRALIEADLVDCMVALPGQLFYSTQIPVCLWFITKNKAADAKRGFRDRRKQTLFIDARKLGTLIDRVHRELTDTNLEKMSATHDTFRPVREMTEEILFNLEKPPFINFSDN